MTRKLTIYLGLIISLIFIVLILKVVDFRGVAAAFSQFKLEYLFILAGLYLYGMVIRTIRWQMLLRQDKKISIPFVFEALAVGFMINNILPAKIGEFARAEYIARYRQISRSFSLGTVFAERMLDTLLVVIFLVLSILFSKTLLAIVKTNIWLFAILVGLILVILIFLLSKKLRKSFVKRMPKKYQIRLDEILNRAAKSVNFLKHKHLFGKIFILTLLIWLGVLAGYLVIFRGFGIHLPIYAYLFIVSAASIGMVIPSTSANIGVYDAVVMSAIVIFMVNKDTALAIAAIAHAFDIIPSVILGMIFLIKRHLSVLTFWKN